MGVARRAFRIETAERRCDPAVQRHHEVMDALARLERRAPVASASVVAEEERAAAGMLDHYRRELAEARKLKDELDAITAAIARTKAEIASLQVANQSGGAMHRVTDELDAVVEGTEGATNTILAAAEVIDEKTSDLIAKLEGDDQGMASDIADQVVKIFEACNFQDLTGQRITKVVAVLRFVEERVARMTEIWGGLGSFTEVVPSVDASAKNGDAALLNGPALPSDGGRATQDMIDALFD
jgi:chemotaxis protein CheZ